jgi:molybdopterin synthase sulfur carrier subunit
MVTLVYLARLRETLGTASEKLQLPGEVGTVAALLAWLRARGGAWSAELAPGRAVRVAVNFAVARGDTPIKAGDEIALFPPVTGG